MISNKIRKILKELMIQKKRTLSKIQRSKRIIHLNKKIMLIRMIIRIMSKITRIKKKEMKKGKIYEMILQLLEFTIMR